MPSWRSVSQPDLAVLAASAQTLHLPAKTDKASLETLQSFGRLDGSLLICAWHLNFELSIRCYREQKYSY